MIATDSATSPLYQDRREKVFLVLAGLFLGSLTMLNILGITRFVDLSFTLFGVTIPMPLAIGVLPYPLTFLCTDFLSEIYGRRRANRVVWTGLLLNAWVVFILWLGSVLPPELPLDPQTGLPPLGEHGRVFFEVKRLALGAVGASMAAYVTAQFCDVWLFHFWKRVTKGRHLWLRNNGSTMVSQVVDAVAVILITHFYAHALPVDESAPIWPQLWTFIVSAYVFKFVIALGDTIPFYIGVAWMRRYLGLGEHESVPDAEI